MAFLKMLGKWVAGNGWCQIMCNTGVATQGVAKLFLCASHVTRTRRAHLVAAGSLHILMNKAYHARQQESEGMNVMSFEDWQIAMANKSPHFQYWASILS